MVGADVKLSVISADTSRDPTLALAVALVTIATAPYVSEARSARAVRQV